MGKANSSVSNRDNRTSIVPGIGPGSKGSAALKAGAASKNALQAGPTDGSEVGASGSNITRGGSPSINGQGGHEIGHTAPGQQQGPPPKGSPALKGGAVGSA